MPIYDYICDTCGECTERIVSFTDPGQSCTVPGCPGKAVRQVSMPSVCKLATPLLAPTAASQGKQC